MSEVEHRRGAGNLLECARIPTRGAFAVGIFHRHGMNLFLP
jgi:hypothetical protein